MPTSRRKFLHGAITLAAAQPLAQALEAPAPRPSLKDDPLRPQYHLLPAKNWMNDPNGPIFWKGKYHMFFQYNPHAAVWGDMHWAHAVSTDMIHWHHLPVAIAPTPGGPDQEGVFSGTAVILDGRVHMMYTGVKKSEPMLSTIHDRSWRETQCLAVANDDDLLTFTKIPQPVIPAPPSGMWVNGFRDPSPWHQNGFWYTPIACGVPNAGGNILLYRSKDLRTWEYRHVFAQRQPSFEAYSPWDVWECPEFFPLGDRHVLIFSTMGKSFWQTGTLDPQHMTFHPEHQGILDYGSFYAPKTQLDVHGNRILWGWIQESRSSEEHEAAGWAGMMSLPRVLTLAPDGRLRYEIAKAAINLRTNERITKAPGIKIPACCGEALFQASRTSGTWTLEIKGERESKPWLAIVFNPEYHDSIFIGANPLQLSGSTTGDVTLHLYFDGSVLELFLNDEVAWTTRFYYPGPAQAAELLWTGQPTTLTKTAQWDLKPISPDRLTT